MRKLFFGIILGMILLILGGWFFRKAFIWQADPVTEETSNVLLEKVKTVSKLVTVEGYFSEVLDHKEYVYFDISMLRKKALVKVKAKVSVGYDLSKTSFDILPLQKKLVISDLPDPEIISIDSEISYYDLSEGIFYAFDAEDLTDLNRRARELIEEKALASPLMETAVTQGEQIFDLIEIIAQESGFTVEYERMQPVISGEPTDTIPG